MAEEKRRRYLEEEKPILEFPDLIWVMIILASAIFGLSILVFSPIISIIVFIGLAFAMGILLNPFVGIVVFLIGAYLRPIGYLPMLRDYHPATVAAICVALIYGLHVIVYRDFRIIKSKQIYLLIAFLTMFAISSFYHYDAPDIKFEVMRFIQLPILYFIIVYMVKTERQLYILSFCLILIGTGTALTAFYRHLYGYGGAVTGGIARAVVFEGNANYLALALVMVVPLILGLAFGLKKFALKIFLFFTAFWCITATIFTFSRSGALGLIAVLILSVFKFIRKQNIMIATLLLIAILTTSLGFIPEQYWNRVATITKVKDFSATSRLGVYKISSKMMIDHPFVGVGMSISRFQEEYFERAMAERNVTALVMEWAHNMFLEVGSKIGLIAMIFFIWFIIQVLADSKRSSRVLRENNKPILFIISESVQIGLAGAIICGLFGDVVYEKIFWIYCGLTMVLANVAIGSVKNIGEKIAT